MTIDRIDDMRRDYREGALTEAGAGGDPLDLFQRWFAHAQAHEIEANAFTLATADHRGQPSARILLCKGVDERGFVFFTNLESRKGQELLRHPLAAMCFYWCQSERQVRIEGSVEEVERAEVETYFRTRPRPSQLGAWASPQSRVIPDRDALEESFASLEQVHATGDIPVPPHWGGFRLVPKVYEFWQGRPSRLHDRFRFARSGDGWNRVRLAP